MNKIITTSEKINKILSRGVEDIIGRDELEKKLSSGKKLRIKFGVDVTRPDIHLGHAIGLRKLREFQELGHTVIFLIGDATTRIGDPTGKDKTRPFLTDKEIGINAKTYIQQVGKILDIERTEIRRNSEWFDKMIMLDFIKLMTMVTHSQLINREAFQKRIAEGREIFAHELIYPIMQGYDSVMLKSDIAVHADQLFNEHFGRLYQEKFGQEPQAILTLPMLVGLDGKNKMSKSLDNYVGIDENPTNMYGKIMSMPDKLIIDYFLLCTDDTEADIKSMESNMQSGKLNPRDAKLNLAFEIVKIYHGEKKAQEAKEEFIKVFSKKELPKEIDEFKIQKGRIGIVDLLLKCKVAESKGEAKRLIEQKGVKLNNKVIGNWGAQITLGGGEILQIGKRKFLRIG